LHALERLTVFRVLIASRSQEHSATSSWPFYIANLLFARGVQQPLVDKGGRVTKMGKYVMQMHTSFNPVVDTV